MGVFLLLIRTVAQSATAKSSMGCPMGNKFIWSHLFSQCFHQYLSIANPQFKQTHTISSLIQFFFQLFSTHQTENAPSVLFSITDTDSCKLFGKSYNRILGKRAGQSLMDTYTFTATGGGNSYVV